MYLLQKYPQLSSLTDLCVVPIQADFSSHSPSGIEYHAGLGLAEKTKSIISPYLMCLVSIQGTLCLDVGSASDSLTE